MKHKLLFALASAMLMSASAWAYEEPTEPAKPSTAGEFVVGGSYFIRNVGAGQYLTGSNDWSTKISLTTDGLDDEASEALILLIEDFTLTYNSVEVTGYSMKMNGTFTVNGASGARTFTGTYLFRDGEEWGFVDWGSQAKGRVWNITKVGDYYRIQTAANDPNFPDAATQYAGWVSGGSTIADGASTAVQFNLTSQDENIDWEFIPCDEYLVQKDAYEARMAMYDVLLEAEDYGIDVDAAVEVYENPQATKEELEAAIAELKYEINVATFEELFEGATFEDPMEVTEYCLVNANFGEGNINGWTCTFQSGVNANNVGYQGASYTNNGTALTGSKTDDDGNASYLQGFIEAWKSNGDPWVIGDAELSQTVYGLPQGMYKLTCDANAVQQWGKFDNPVTGVKLYIATDDGQEVFQEVATNDGSPEHFSITFTCPEGVKSLTFGLKTESTTANWIAADNFRIYYYGASERTLAQFKLEEAIVAAQKYLDEEPNIDFSNEDVYNACVAAIEAAQPYVNTGSDDECAEQEAIVTAAYNAIKTSVAQYQDMDDFLQDAGAYDGKGFGYYEDVTADWSEINDQLFDLQEKLDEGLANRTLTAEDYEEFHAYVSNLINDIREMIKAGGIQPGQDITILLDNPDFSEGNGGRNLTGDAVPGWTIEGSLTEHRIQTGNIETWHSNFNIHQTITNMPAGVYDITVQGFVRHDAANLTNQTIFYAGDSQPALMQCSDQWSEEMIYGPDQAEMGDTNRDLTNPNGGYQCNGMTGAYYWFQTPNPNGADMKYPGWKEGDNYYTNHIKVVLKEAGDLTIGIKCDGGNDGPQDWVIWDNFQITYIGEDMEAYEVLLGDAWTEVQTAYNTCYDETGIITKENEDNFKTMSDFMEDKGYGDFETAEEFVAKLDEMDALKTALQENLTKAQAWMATYSEYQGKYDLLPDEIDSYYLDQSELYLPFGDYMIEVDPEDDSIEYASNDTFDEKAAELIANWDAMMAEIAEIKMQEASEENPVDLTAEYIKNADFELLNANYWDIVAYEEGGRIGANQGYMDNATYTGENAVLDHFVEAWRETAFLSNGTITQNLGVLPAGTYRLEVDAQAVHQAQLDPLAEGEETNGVYLIAYVGEDELSTDICIQGTEANPQHVTLDFFADGESEVTIGLLVFNTNANWMAADNFKLFSLGKDVLTAVESVKTQNAAAKAIFSIDGRQQGQLRRGINIVRMADGNVRKVLVK